MCDRVVDHMRPAVEKIVKQAMDERGLDSAQAGRITGVGMYGVMMMARRGEMDMKRVAEMFARVAGVAMVA